MIDAVPAAGRAAAIATMWALLTHDDAGDAVTEACRSLADLWPSATERGLHDDAVKHASVTLLDLTAATLQYSAPTLAEACLSSRDDHMLSTAQPGSVDELLKGSAETQTASSGPVRRRSLFT